MILPPKSFFDKFGSMVEAAELCLQHKKFDSALALVYVTMGAMAWVSMPTGQKDVTRRDFYTWVDRYLLPGSGLACTAEELYGARCGMLHSLTVESTLSRQGKVRTIHYAWGHANQAWLDAALPDVPAVTVHLSDLLLALVTGLARLLCRDRRRPDTRGTRE